MLSDRHPHVRNVNRIPIEPESVRNLLAVAVAHLLEIGVGNRRTVDGKFADGQPAAGFGGLRPLSADGKRDGTGCFRSEGEFAERPLRADRGWRLPRYL